MSWLQAIGIRRRHEQDADGEPEEGDAEYEEAATDGSANGRASAAPSEGDDLKPSAMRGNEMLYGYLIAGELVLVAILNLTVTHGKGAPTHPSRPIEVVGLLASLALFGVLQTRHRFIVPFAMIIAAYIVVYPKTPDSLTLAHLLGLILPVVYAILLMQRQRKAALAQARGRGGRGGGARLTPEERRAEATQRRQERRDKRRGIIPPSGPQKSSRYTPPKARRPKP
jgi:hypothetical protein